jgi:uncharacterized protein
MLYCIMRFLDRRAELERLDALASARGARLAVLYGRRRVGKTRLLLEWAGRHAGLYTVADQSASDVQRRYLASAIAPVFPGFADVEYPDWAALFGRLAREARAARWRGPFILDELPYLVLAAPELPSVLQRWIDHEAEQSGLKVAIAGSSQRMMQGLVLSAAAPLYGRAHELFEVKPLPAAELRRAFGTRSLVEVCELYTAWGGIPRYWELAAEAGRDVARQIDRLVLDPLGPLHTEPERLLLEELPPAVELRPILDAIGLGAHRVTEIGSRIGRPATSLARPLQRLQEMGLVRRETPFGELETQSKRSLYRLDDPFVRLWFRVVARNRARLVSISSSERLAVLRTHWPGLVAVGWEELCRALVTQLRASTPLGALGPWQPGERWWRGSAPEWDLVSRSGDGTRILVAEIKWSAKQFDRGSLERLTQGVASRVLPMWSAPDAEREITRALFVPLIGSGVPRQIGGVHIVQGSALF